MSHGEKEYFYGDGNVFVKRSTSSTSHGGREVDTTSPSSEGVIRSDVYVTSADVFDRPFFIDPTSRHGIASNSSVLSPSETLQRDSTGHHIAHSTHAASIHRDKEHITGEFAVSKIKRFSSPNAYTAANTVKDLLKETIGEAGSADEPLTDSMLRGKRVSFLKSLFTGGEEVKLALPCRFSIDEARGVFLDLSITGLEATRDYRKRLALLAQLRKNLEC